MNKVPDIVIESLMSEIFQEILQIIAETFSTKRGGVYSVSRFKNLAATPLFAVLRPRSMVWEYSKSVFSDHIWALPDAVERWV